MVRHKFRTVEDHEEFLSLVEDSDTGLYVQELWNLHSMRRDKPVTSINVARKAFKALYERQGWDKGLMAVGHGVTLRPWPEDVAASGASGARRRRRSIGTDLSVDGFWWATAPFGYWESFDVPESHLFEVREATPGGLHGALWAFEYTARLAPKDFPRIPEFSHQWECAREGGTFYSYDTSPEAPRSEEDFADRRRRFAPLQRRLGKR